MSDHPKSKLRAGAGQIVAAVGRLTTGLRAKFLHEGDSIRKASQAMEGADEIGARGIASLPAMRELLAHNEKRALELLRNGLSGHYGRPGADGTRLYLDIGKAAVFRHQKGMSLDTGQVARKLHFAGDIYDQRAAPPVGEFAMSFVETKDGKLVANASLVQLDEYVRQREFTGHLMLGLRDYFQRSGVEHVKIPASLTHGGRGWAGICDWDPDKEVANRVLLMSKMHIAMFEAHHPADRAAIHWLQERIKGPIESWPSPREILAMEGRSKTLGQQIMQGSHWWGKYQL